MGEGIPWDEYSKKHWKEIEQGHTFEEAIENAEGGFQGDESPQDTTTVETLQKPETFVVQIDLNQQQLEAVQYPINSNLMIVAGPGTGKTHVLVARVLYLIQQGVPPENIVVTTFTNRVTSTLVSRITQLAGADIAKRLLIHNFYSICQGLLHSYGAEINVETDFDVADEIELEAITDDVISSSTKDIKEREILKSRIKQFYMAKQSGIDAEILNSKTALSLVEKIQAALHERKLLSYHDLLELGTELVERFPSSVTHIEATLVDEFQDLSPLHWRFIKGLSQHSKSITLVGDPDQSIFRFSGSRPEIFNVAQNGMENMAVVKLDVNYRSVPSILSTANSLMSQDTRRSAKSVVSSVKSIIPKENEFVTHLRKFLTPIEETEWIASEISMLIKKGSFPSDIAILVRSSRDLKSLKSSLESLNIAYTLAGDKFWELPSFRRLFALIKVIDQPGKDFYVENCFSLEKGVGKIALSSVQKNRDTLNSSFWEALTSKENSFSARVGNLVNIFTDKVISGIDIINEDPTNNIQVVKLLDYLFTLPEFEASILERPEYRLYVKILYNTASNSSTSAYDRKRSLLQNFMSNIRKIEFISTSNEVTISTFHSAKGFEWPTVFIPRLNDNSLPVWFAHKNEVEVDEERRVLYVGITRAKSALYMTYSTSTIVGPVAISRFLSPSLRKTIGLYHKNPEKTTDINSSYSKLVSSSELEQLRNVFRYPTTAILNKKSILPKTQGFSRHFCTRANLTSNLTSNFLRFNMQAIARFIRK